MSFTRIKDVDLEILSKMNDRELGRICSTDKYFRNLCKNDDFWRNRTMKRFGKYFGDKLYYYFQETQLPTWREYYISVVDFLEKIYNRQLIRLGGRRDLQLLVRMIKQNHEILKEEIKKRFEKGVWKEILKLELVNPNVAFDYYDHPLQNGEILIRYLLTLSDERIKPYVALKKYLDAELDLDQDEDYMILDTKIRKKLAEMILDDARVNIENVSQIVADILPRYHIEEFELFDLYLKYIVEKGGADKLREKILGKGNERVIKHIYDVISPYLSSSLPKIQEILNTTQFSEYVYHSILSDLQKYIS